MRSGPNTRRPMRRGNSSNNSGGGGRRGGSPRSQSFDSNGPDIKVRGNAQQVVDKYQALAREASTAGDPVMAENYYQHAEHYFRVLNANGGGDNRQGNRPQENNNNNNGNNDANGADENPQQHGNPTQEATPAAAPESGAENQNHKQEASATEKPVAVNGSQDEPAAEPSPVKVEPSPVKVESSPAKVAPKIKTKPKPKPESSGEETTEPAA